MKIAILDYRVVSTNPIGGCHLRLLAALCREHEFTVFAPRFDNPDPSRITHVRIPVPVRPQFLLFLTYHLVAPLFVWLHRRRAGVRFDLMQTVECNTFQRGLSYVHFCHSAFMRLPGMRLSGMRLSGGRGFGARRWLRWADHRLRALAEPWAYARARHLIVPSEGLKRELEQAFPSTRQRLTVIRNPIRGDIGTVEAGFDREAFRRQFGLRSDTVVLLFVALGHFERKGLPLLIEALSRLRPTRVEAFIVGGEEAELAPYRAAAAAAGVAEQARFFGFRSDVRPYFWAADAFILPSSYEACPLVVLEAAAARLPLIVTRLNGVEDFAHDGESAFVVERSVEAIAHAISRFASLSPAERRRMGLAAEEAVRPYTLSAFVEQWRQIYRGWKSHPEAGFTADARPA